MARLVAVTVLWCWLLFGLRVLKVIPHDDYLIPWERQTVEGPGAKL